MTARRWGIITLNLIGLAVSGYLTYTHLANTDPVCGGIADCSYVQASSYATIMGVPIALLGFVAYLLMLILNIKAFTETNTQTQYTLLQAVFGLAVAGTLYSAYLTYIEAFVLHAYCLYCVTSAIAITLMTVFLAIEVLQYSSDNAYNA